MLLLEKINYENDQLRKNTTVKISNNLEIFSRHSLKIILNLYIAFLLANDYSRYQKNSTYIKHLDQALSAKAEIESSDGLSFKFKDGTSIRYSNTTKRLYSTCRHDSFQSHSHHCAHTVVLPQNFTLYIEQLPFSNRVEFTPCNVLEFQMANRVNMAAAMIPPPAPVNFHQVVQQPVQQIEAYHEPDDAKNSQEEISRICDEIIRDGDHELDINMLELNTRSPGQSETGSFTIDEPVNISTNVRVQTVTKGMVVDEIQYCMDRLKYLSNDMLLSPTAQLTEQYPKIFDAVKRLNGVLDKAQI